MTSDPPPTNIRPLPTGPTNDLDHGSASETGDDKRLTRPAFWIVFAISYTVFLVVDNPLFGGDPFDIDASILWSYSLIPILVAAFLVKDKRWNLAGFFVSCVELAGLKFVATYVVAATLWGIRLRSEEPDPSTVVAAPRPSWHPTDKERAAYPKEVLDAAKTSTVTGRVVDRDGRPLAGATVWIARGIERYTFPAPSTIVTVRHHDRGYETNSVVIRSGQPVLIRTESEGSHTAVVRELGASNVVFNRPVVKDGKKLRLTLDSAIGWVTLRCTMHESTEKPLELLIVDHPYTKESGERGEFTLNHVPAGDLQLKAHLPGRRDATVTVTTPNNQPLTLTMGEPTEPVSPER